MSAGAQIDYAALAQQAGAISSQPAPQSGNVDYASLAKQAGATSSQPSSTTQPETGIWAGVKRNTVGMVAGLYHAFTDPATEQEKQDILAKTHGNLSDSMATNPVALAYHRLIDAPGQVLSQKGTDQIAAAKDLLSKGQTWKGSNAYVSGAIDKVLSLVPGIGPWLNSVAQRYESGDVSGAATDIAAATAYMNAPEIVKTVSPKVAQFFKGSAQKNYEDVLNPTKIPTKYQTQQIMPQLLEERPIAMTRQGLSDLAGEQAEQAGQQVEQAVSGLQGSMKTQPVIDGLENLRKSYQVNGVSLRPEVDGAIDMAQNQLRAISQEGVVQGAGPGEAEIPYQDVVKARRILDDAVAEVGGYQGRPLSDTSLANIRKATANSLRQELGNASPDLAAVNAKFHFWSTLQDVIDQTMQRKTGQVNALPKVETVVAGAGGLARSGISGAAMYAGAINLLGKAIRSTGWRTVSAATKSGIADALASGQFDTAVGLLGKTGLAGQALSQSAQSGDTQSPRFKTNNDLYDADTLRQWQQDHGQL
ncbi:MAG TPA: hypothetical protein VGT24_09430 [Candidatus Acidoferrales bacterium]|nr:hypothetical protein [Candidatus Acidoferrales bacterium]